MASENLAFYTTNTHLRHVLIACSPLDTPPTLLSTLPLQKLTLIESHPLPATITSLPLKTTRLPTIFVPPPPPQVKSPRSRDPRGPQLQLMQQEDDGGGATWLVIQPDGGQRSKSQGGGRRKGDRDRDDDNQSLSISIGPDNTVSVDSGRRRRIM